MKYKKSNQSNQKISIIVPVYNAEKYLDRCLTALINQTFKEIEILCINDGSTDGSLEILNRYQQLDSRVRVFSQKNSGPAKARNVGLKNMRGEYLMFCDADDCYEPTMCEEMHKNIMTYNTDFVMCNTYAYDSNNFEIESLYYFPFKNGKKVLSAEEKSKINVYLWNKIFKTELVRKYHIEFPVGHKADDNFFVFAYLTISKQSFLLDNKLYHHYSVPNSIMHQYYGNQIVFQDIKDKSDILSLLYDFLVQHKIVQENIVFLKTILYNELFFAWLQVPDEWKEDFLTQWKLLLHKIKLKIWSEHTPIQSLFSYIYNGDFYQASNLLDAFASEKKRERRKSIPNLILHPIFLEKCALVFNCDEAFIPFLSVTLSSIQVHSKPQYFYDIVILNHNISRQSQRIITNMFKVQKNFNIRFYDMKEYVAKYHIDSWMSLRNIKPSAYYRLFIPIIFSNFKRVIYLDCDLIVNTDISELYHIPLHNKPLGAVKDLFVSKVNSTNDFLFPGFYQYAIQTMELPHLDEYVNSGVLVLDISKINTNKYEHNIIEAVQKNTAYFHDQNIWNMLFYSEVCLLDETWNVQINNGNILGKATYPKPESIKILHFCSKFKPWNTLHWKSNEISIQWWMYARLSPFYEKILFDTVRTGYSPSYKFPLKDILNFPKAYWTYLRCRILSNFTWGEKRQHYLYKKHVFHNEVRRIRKLLK